MKVALIGAGNIGLSGVLPALLAHGHDVTVITRRDMDVPGAAHWALDYHHPSFADALRKKHFDALISMITFNEQDADVLLAACGQQTQVVFISTVCVYGGELVACPATETTDLRPITPYGVNKMLAERRLNAHSRTTVFRLASTIGPAFPVLRQLSVTSQWISRLIAIF